MLYSIRSERLLMEELDYNILYRWFVGLSLDDAVWDATTFTKNRDGCSMAMSRTHFFRGGAGRDQRATGCSRTSISPSMGTLLEAWASHKSFKPKDGRTGRPMIRRIDVNFHGQTRRNEHARVDHGSRRPALQEGRRP